jgi:hypothetical protein
VPAQPVDATPSDQLIRQCFPKRIDLYGGTQSEPTQGFVLFELGATNEIGLVDSFNNEDSKQVLQRRIVTTPLIKNWLPVEKI